MRLPNKIELLLQLGLSSITYNYAGLKMQQQREILSKIESKFAEFISSAKKAINDGTMTMEIMEMAEGNVNQMFQDLELDVFHAQNTLVEQDSKFIKIGEKTFNIYLYTYENGDTSCEICSNDRGVLCNSSFFELSDAKLTAHLKQISYLFEDSSDTDYTVSI